MGDIVPNNIHKGRRVLMELKRRQRNMSREVTIQKKKQCARTAQEIVERMIEPDVDECWMLKNLVYVNQEHFDDVIEERFITKHCGYPLCDNVLNDIPTKRYRISTKTNRVYDITDRKKYCSNICFKASQHIRDQLLTSPLWLRDFEEPVYFHLYPLNNKSCVKGSPGKPMDISFTERLEPYTDTNLTYQEVNLNENCCQAEMRLSCLASDTRTCGSSSPHTDECREKEYSYIDVNLRNFNVDSEMESEDESMKPSQKKDVMDLISMQKVVEKVEQSLRSWFTLDALCYLLGTHRVKDLMVQNGIPPNKCEEMCDPDPFFYERYAAICKKLNNLELQEKRKVELHSDPFGLYDDILNDTQDLQLQVDIGNGNRSEPDSPMVAQYNRAMRRRSVLDTLDKILPDIKNALGLSAYNFGTSVRHLVSLMNLTTANILYKPTEWSFIAIIIIKLLTLRDEKLNLAVASEPVSTHLQLILMSFEVDLAYLERLVCWFTDLEYLVNTRATVKIM